MPAHIEHVILDRDGVLNAEGSEGGYVCDWSQWRWLPGAIESIGMLCAAGVRISVVSNQSGVGRGLIAPVDLDAIHARMRDEASREGGVIDRVLICPHRPESGCGCRKPAPGLVVQAIEASRLPKETTIAVGDDLRDLQAARAAGIRAVLVRTGKGRLTEAMVSNDGVAAFDDLHEFATALLSNFPSSAQGCL